MQVAEFPANSKNQSNIVGVICTLCGVLRLYFPACNLTFDVSG